MEWELKSEVWISREGSGREFPGSKEAKAVRRKSTAHVWVGPRAMTWLYEFVWRKNLPTPTANSVRQVQFSLATQSCPTLRYPMDCSTPGLPVHHQLPEFTQTHVHWISDANKPSFLSPHPYSSLPAFNLSQHQGLFKWVCSSHQVAKILEFQLQHQSFQGTPRTDLLQDGLVGSPCSPRDSQESSPTAQFKSINSLALGFLHSPTLTSILY